MKLEKLKYKRERERISMRKKFNAEFGELAAVFHYFFKFNESVNIRDT